MNINFGTVGALIDHLVIGVIDAENKEEVAEIGDARGKKEHVPKWMRQC